MAVIQPIRQDVKNKYGNKRHSAAIRLWHWMNVLIITGSLVTLLINSTLFEDKLIKALPQGKSIFHTLEDKIWGIHIYFGYALAVLFVFRIAQELFQRSDQNFWHQLKIVYKDYFFAKENRDQAKHELIVKLLYIIFYMLLSLMVITGLALAFQEQLSIPRNITHSVQDFHGFCMYLIIAFVVVHVAGVILAERKDSSGIVSDMINGGKDA
jgi:Ni/Fe-hydrogenase 1 B-type cytochrome subunit